MKANYTNARKYLEEDMALAKATSKEERYKILLKRCLREGWEEFIDNLKIVSIVIVFIFLVLKTFRVL